ncbi:phosphoribosylaminoimidazolesuccinocarboxamide synthase [Dehalococcoides mccartyi]|uniref:Phosphoribosylaminoimidazole-succinocarboxamide synthase n=1 Tax=Dehalococcoides mccartyi TaxID=61435 RepID=A0A1S7ATJ9_9CHLR|nr:phosphoribosylaminoimidazolesuccinocarboxamide synthase [Dehalococcoides mccartyi]AGG07852.1 phosphoribosylaminoimidazole-succinocarboxamide synthase [Dehalococcoides mccartyi BTF08]AQX73213.1 phosphoribosylaminoimidazolesuccinocarboxamide synthase [Dehalococcoides mccartyi]KSV17052.1 phosphoribosylaminoimidazole-succinocarboxamide synthase [Dehalococcoides mccartyi]PKH46261.1 phosphoribosylaminoimidazolesuccinocarboxamide synthase [Dehalococcoides mccartyi]PKH47138.1 phosphoribosylaminoimi
MTDIKVLMETALPLPSFIKGKVRDTYLLGDKLLIVASDRISAFDVILPSGISGKGRVLNRISSFWFEKTAHIIPNHVIELVENTSCLDKYLTSAERFKYPEYLIGRSMVVKKVNRVSVECVVRGYIAGSAWSEYKKLGTVNGVSMPKGLQQSQELPEPIFTPTTKGDGEHDRPMSIAELEGMVGKDLADKLARKSLELYKFGREYARNRGIIIADTKFEFGLDGTELILIDEALTPDSSRFWDEKTYKVGEAQDSYDKQPVRDYLETISWNKEPPGPVLPDEVIKSTTRRYEYAYERITGLKLG